LTSVTGPFDLSGRVALVTGAGSETGIGFAAAVLLGSMGARVGVTATSERIDLRVAELRDLGIDAVGVAADLTESTQAGLVVESIVQRLGGLDIVVNNAGMTSVTDPVDSAGGIQMSDVEWRAGVSRNLDTAYFVTRSAWPHLLSARAGRVVNVASITGPVMAMRAEPVYAAAKAGMVGLTRALALEGAESGVTVNAVCPGWIATGSQSEHERLQGERTPMRRSATAEEVASAICWLATPGASYITGQCVVVDGGNSIAEERA